MIGAGLSIPQLAVRRPGAADQAITATAAPQLGPLAGGDTLSGAVTWGSYETSQGSLVTPHCQGNACQRRRLRGL